MNFLPCLAAHETSSIHFVNREPRHQQTAGQLIINLIEIMVVIAVRTLTKLTISRTENHGENINACRKEQEGRKYKDLVIKLVFEFIEDGCKQAACKNRKDDE